MDLKSQKILSGEFKDINKFVQQIILSQLFDIERKTIEEKIFYDADILLLWSLNRFVKMDRQLNRRLQEGFIRTIIGICFY